MNGQGLIKEILAKPFEDEPRLIFADWLEECGESERAAFIRIQCEYARTGYWEPGFEKLRKQSIGFLTKHEKVWKKQLGIRSRAYFRRGFIEDLTVTPKAMLELDPKVFSHAPIMSIQLSRFDSSKLQQVGKTGILKSVLGVNVNGGRSMEEVFALFGMVSSKVEKLDLSASNLHFDSKFGEAIGRASFAKKLKGFYLRACVVDETFFEALADAGGLPKIQRFEFGGGFEIAHPAHFENLKMKKLRHLVAGGKFRIVDCQQLCHLPLKKLLTINLRGTRLPAAGLKLLIEAGAFKNAERISLANCNLSRNALKMFIDNKAIKCTHLELPENKNLDNELLGQILNGKGFAKLQAIHVAGTHVKVTKKIREATSVTIVS